MARIRLYKYGRLPSALVQHGRDELRRFSPYFVVKTLTTPGVYSSRVTDRPHNRVLLQAGYFCLFVLGFDPRVLFKSLRYAPLFLESVYRYQKVNANRSFRIKLSNLLPVLHERNLSAGTARGHYFHQDLWAARKIFTRSPGSHVDIGSRIDGFVAHLLTFMSVTIIDIRALRSDVSGLMVVQDDATEMKTIPDDSVSSLSSLHAAEHFGLGRYSDPIDPDSCFLFMRALQRVLAPGGILYFSVPVGKERVAFNAHRVFAPATIINTFYRLQLLSFSLIDDVGEMHEMVEPSLANHSEYACGLFEFVKPDLRA